MEVPTSSIKYTTQHAQPIFPTQELSASMQVTPKGILRRSIIWKISTQHFTDIELLKSNFQHQRFEIPSVASQAFLSSSIPFFRESCNPLPASDIEYTPPPY